MLPHPERRADATPALRLAEGSRASNVPRTSRRRDLSPIRTLALEMGEADSTEAALDALLASIAKATDWCYAEAWLVEEGVAEACVSINTLGASLHDFASIFAGTRIVATEGLPGLAVRAKAPVWIEDLSLLDAGIFLRRGRGLEAGFEAAAILPLLSQGETQAIATFFLRADEMPELRERRLIENAVLPLGELLRHHRLEHELRERDRDLERRLDESRLRVDRLVEQVRDAERWASVGTFAAGVVHDLTNSLFPLRCRSDLLRRLELPAQAKEHLDAIDAAVSYLDRLAANLRALCRGEGPAVGAGATECLATWWREHRRLVQGQLGASVALQTVFEPNLPPILVGEDSLTQMVVNLADSAAKAVDGRGHVVITAALDDDERHVRLCVADNGPGMTAAQRRSAFSARSADREGVGRGFGLAMVRGLVERAGGAIEIDATEGEGTRVTLLLPIDGDRSRETARPAAVLVSLGDPRTAGMVVELFRLLHGGRIDLDEASTAAEDVEILVVDADERSAVEARRFIDGSSRRRVLAIGGGGSAWKEIRATVVADPHNAGTLRDGVAEVVAERPIDGPLQGGGAT